MINITSGDLVVVDRPTRNSFVWAGRGCVFFSSLSFLYMLFSHNVFVEIRELAPFLFMLFVSGLVVGFSKKEVVFSSGDAKIYVFYSLVFRFLRKEYNTSDYEKVMVEVDRAKVEVGDIGEKATTSRGVLLYYVILVSKNLDRCPSLQVKKFFNQDGANNLVKKISAYKFF